MIYCRSHTRWFVAETCSHRGAVKNVGYGVRARARAPCARARTIVRSHHSMLIEALLALSEVP